LIEPKPETVPATNAPRPPRRLTFAQRVGRRLSIIAHNMYVDLNHDHRNTVLLCGSGRSGTTWLVDVANYDNRYRLMIEPFNRGRVPAVKDFHRRQYLRTSNTDPTYLGPATAIFTGALRDGFIDQLNRRIVASSRIVKDVGCTLMLGWLRARFPGMPIILLLRNPCAVAYSRTKLGWDDVREDYLSQPDVIADHLAPFADAIRAAKPGFEQHVFTWCVENYIPFRQFAAGDVHVAFYEKFCVDPVRELDRMFGFLGRPYDERIFAHLTRSVVSGRTAGRPRPTAIMTVEALNEPWRRHLSQADIDRAREIVASFGLDRVYDRDGLPDLSGALSTFAGASGVTAAGE
jgi:sulfotransferase family protein